MRRWTNIVEIFNHSLISSTLLLVKILVVFNALWLSYHYNMQSDCIITHIFWPIVYGSASKALSWFFLLFYWQRLKTSHIHVSSMFRFLTIIWGRPNIPLSRTGCLRFYEEFRSSIFIGWQSVSTSKMHILEMNILTLVFLVTCRFLPFSNRFCWFCSDLWILHQWGCPFLIDRVSRLTRISQKLPFYYPSRLKIEPCAHFF